MSAIIDSESLPIISYVNQYFSDPYYDLRYSQVHYQTFSTVNGISDETTTFTFNFPKQDDNTVYDLDNILMNCGISIQTPSGLIAEDTLVSPINNIMLSAFKSLRIYINNKIVLNLNQYGIYCYLMTLLNTTKTAQKTYLPLAGWYMDKTGQFDSFVAAADGFKERRNLFSSIIANKTTFSLSPTQFFGKLFVGLNVGDLLPGSSVSIELDKQDNEYFFLSASAGPFVFKIKNLTLYVPIKSLSENVFVDLKQSIKTRKAQLRVNTPQIIHYTIPSKMTMFSTDSINFTQKPSRLILMFQEATAFQGSCKYFKRNLQATTNSICFFSK